MNHQSKYLIPDFQLHELVSAEYGYQLTRAPGNSYYCSCPIHNHSTPGRNGAMRIYAHPGRDSTPKHGGYTCKRPGTGGSAWDFLTEHMGMPGPDDPRFDETILYICELLDLEPKLRDNFEPSPGDKARRLLADIQGALEPIGLKQANQHYQQSDDGRWLYRGVEPMTWLQYDVGQITELKLKEIISRYDEDVIEAAGLNSWSGMGYQWLTQGVIAMRRSEYGTPIGILVRRYPQYGRDDMEATYVKNGSNSVVLDTQKYLFGLDGALDCEEPELYVVEGEFDQLAFRVRGMPNVVTYGSGQPTRDQIGRLLETGKHLVFIADSDANAAGFEHVTYMAERVPSAEFVFLPGEGTDPDSYVQAHGIEALQNLSRYTALHVQMLAEDHYDWQSAQWAPSQQTALVQNYMERVIESPSVHDERNVQMIAALSDYDEQYLKSWLFKARNQEIINQTDQPLRLSR